MLPFCKTNKSTNGPRKNVHLAYAESILFTLSQINADREENKTNWLKRMLKQYDFFLT